MWLLLLGDTMFDQTFLWNHMLVEVDLFLHLYAFVFDKAFTLQRVLFIGIANIRQREVR